jgi:hypothetical protein
MNTMTKSSLKSRGIVSVLFVALAIMGSQSMAFGQGNSEVNQQIAQLRRATARYHDLNKAIEDGFTPLTGLCHNGDDGYAVGISYINRARFISPEVNPDEPEFLNYFPIGNGNVRLVGVAFTNRALFRDTRPPTTPGYLPGIFPWRNLVIPAYLQEVSGAFSLFGQQARTTFGPPWLYIVTVWPWAENPNGMFADGNPSLSCP